MLESRLSPLAVEGMCFQVAKHLLHLALLVNCNSVYSVGPNAKCSSLVGDNP